MNNLRAGMTVILLVLLTATFGLVIVSGDTWSFWHGVGLVASAGLLCGLGRRREDWPRPSGRNT